MQAPRYWKIHIAVSRAAGILLGILAIVQNRIAGFPLLAALLPAVLVWALGEILYRRRKPASDD